MATVSVFDSKGLLQNVHGPNPSFTQMIFPQLRQFGAAARRGWRVAMQLQERDALFSLAEAVKVGFVWSSRERIAESRAERVADAPCMGVPPVMFTLVLGAGEEVRVLGALLDVGLRSEMRRPVADGGGRDVGAWTALGVL